MTELVRQLRRLNVVSRSEDMMGLIEDAADKIEQLLTEKMDLLQRSHVFQSEKEEWLREIEQLRKEVTNLWGTIIERNKTIAALRGALERIERDPYAPKWILAVCRIALAGTEVE